MPSRELIAEMLGSEALNNIATLNQISDSYIGIWDLESTSNDVPTEVDFLPHKNFHFNSRITVVDKRQQVADTDIHPGGKYRSIVKLFLRYSNQRASDSWTTGTGWLIAPDLIVTAGHHAFDWSYKKGRLAQVKAYVGYNGKSSIDDPQIAAEFRQGSQVATPSEWLRSKGMKAYDVAFIKVHQPFTEVVPFEFEDTPKSTLSNIGVVGYAGDITDRFTGEKGAHMYEVFQNIEWNLEKSEYTMLEYALDPYGGNSGSPLFRQDRLISIGTHVQGGNPSLASVIGNLGIPYKNYIATFAGELKISDPRASQTVGPVSYIRVSTTGELPQVLDVQQSYPNRQAFNDAESINIHQTKNSALVSETQVNGSFSRDQSNGVRDQTQANGSSDRDQSNNVRNPSQTIVSDYQPKSNLFSTQAAISSGQNADATSNSNYQPQSNSPNTQAAMNEGEVGQATSSTDYRSMSNVSNSQAKVSDEQITHATSRTQDQSKSNVSSAPVAKNDGQITQADSASDSDFFEILKLGIRLSDPVLNDILHVYSPIVLGLIGSPLGALAGAVLASAGKFAATHSAPIHDFRQGLPYDGVLERAILGEAAFTVVMSMKRRKLEELGIFADMAEVVHKMASITEQIAPFIMHILTAPALRVALHALNDDSGYSRSGPEVTESGHENPFAQRYTPSARPLEPDVDTFLKRLLAHCLNDEESQDSFGNINRIIQVGFREAGPVLTTTAREGLEYLTSTLPDSGVLGPGIPSRKPYIIGLPERAMLGEAALQALINVPKHLLHERVFDIMAQTIDSIGGIVLQLAPGLIEDVGFSIKAMVVVPLIGTEGIVDDAVVDDAVVDDNFVNDGIANAGIVDNGAVDDGTGDDSIADDGLSAETLAGEVFQTAANRHAKGLSYVNLEREFLSYYRDNNSKQMPAIVENRICSSG